MRLLPLVLIASSIAGAQAPEASLNRAMAARATVKTARGTFEQTVTNALVGSSAQSRGDFEEERPNRIAIRFTQPAGDRIVGDGNAVWVFLPSSTPGQVFKRPATDASAGPLDIEGQVLDAPATRFDLSDGGTLTIDGHATHAVQLVPKKTTRAPFTRATVWIDDDDSQIREFESTESNGVTRRVHLTTLAVNVPVDRSAFTFSVPKGVKVVDQSP